MRYISKTEISYQKPLTIQIFYSLTTFESFRQLFPYTSPGKLHNIFTICNLVPKSMLVSRHVISACVISLALIMAEENGEHSFASPISRSISHFEFFWVSGLSHLPFANAQKVHQTDSNPGPHDQ